MPEIKGVEIFSTGVWNGHQVTSQHLDEMVEAFNSTKETLPPFLKLGHSREQKWLEESGLPAAGWVSSLYVRGSKLVADFAEVPQKVYELIKKRSYRKVSSEILCNIELGGKKFANVLCGVALLGAETPGVMNLTDVLSLYGLQTEGAPNTIERKQIVFTGGHKMDEELKKQIEEANKKIEQLAQANAEFKADIESTKAALAKAEADKADLKVKGFVAELKAEGLVTPAMEKIVGELVSDKKEFSVDGKAKTRPELVRELLSLGKEIKKVNFTEQSSGGDVEITEDKSEDKAAILKLMKDRGLEFAAAYKVHMSSKKGA